MDCRTHTHKHTQSSSRPCLPACIVLCLFASGSSSSSCFPSLSPVELPLLRGFRSVCGGMAGPSAAAAEACCALHLNANCGEALLYVYCFPTKDIPVKSRATGCKCKRSTSPILARFDLKLWGWGGGCSTRRQFGEARMKDGICVGSTLALPIGSKGHNEPFTLVVLCVWNRCCSPRSFFPRCFHSSVYGSLVFRVFRR